MFKIVLRAGTDLAEHNLLGRTTTQHAADAVHERTAREQELVFARELHGVAKRGTSTRHNADLVDRIGVLLYAATSAWPTS